MLIIVTIRYLLCMHSTLSFVFNNITWSRITQCTVWTTCMQRDPTKIGRSRVAVSAEMLAEVVDGFLDGISWRSLVSMTFALAQSNLPWYGTDGFLGSVRLPIPVPPPFFYPCLPSGSKLRPLLFRYSL